MIDEKRALQWAKGARVALMQHYGKDDRAAHCPVIVLALLEDREERERFIERSCVER